MAIVGLLTDTVEMHGGDILKFAGDAIIVCWSPTRELGIEVGHVNAMLLFHACLPLVRAELREYCRFVPLARKARRTFLSSF